MVAFVCLCASLRYLDIVVQSVRGTRKMRRIRVWLCVCMHVCTKAYITMVAWYVEISACMSRRCGHCGRGHLTVLREGKRAAPPQGEGPNDSQLRKISPPHKRINAYIYINIYIYTHTTDDDAHGNNSRKLSR